jgi:hypothetical protein
MAVTRSSFTRSCWNLSLISSADYSTNSTYLLSLLSELYVVRSTPLWKEPSTLAWFHQTALATADSLDDSSLPDVVIGERLFLQGPWETGYAPAGIIRAAFISDIPSIRPYLPPAALSGRSIYLVMCLIVTVTDETSYHHRDVIFL